MYHGLSSVVRESLKIFIFFCGLLYDDLTISEQRVLNIMISVKNDLKNICKGIIIA
jgi:hypothetical protein